MSSDQPTSSGASEVPLTTNAFPYIYRGHPHSHFLPYHHHQTHTPTPSPYTRWAHTPPIVGSHAYLATPPRSGPAVESSGIFYIPPLPLLPQATPLGHTHSEEYRRLRWHEKWTNHIAAQSGGRFNQRVAPSLPQQSPGDTTSLLPGQRESQEGAAPVLSGQSPVTRDLKRKWTVYSSPLETNSDPSTSPSTYYEDQSSKFKVPRLGDHRTGGAVSGSFRNSHDPIPHSTSSSINNSQSDSSSSSSSGSGVRDQNSPRRVSLSVRLPLYAGGATPTPGVADGNQTTVEESTEGESEPSTTHDHTDSTFGEVPQLEPTTSSSVGTTQDEQVPLPPSSVVAQATQSRGRGFSLSVEISGSDSVNSIDFNLDMSGIPTSLSRTPSLSPSPPSPYSIPSLSPSPSPSPSVPDMSSNQPGTSGLSRDEIIIVDSSDDEDDHTLIMFAPHDPSNRRRGNGRHETAQLTQDERLARHLQAEYDRELEVAVGNQTTSSMLRPRRMVPSLTEIRGRRRDLNDGNLWSSRGPSGAVSVIPYIATEALPTYHPTSSNYRALASHIQHITPSDAHRLLHAASLSGHAPSVGGARRRQSRFHSNQSLIFSAIMGRHTSYEELIELAERLGPAHSRGLSREEINRLPSRTHRKKDGDDKSCVVCMCEFQVREKIRTLMPCRHDFHQKCIDKWLKDHSTCPICREKVKPTAS